MFQRETFSGVSFEKLELDSRSVDLNRYFRKFILFQTDIYLRHARMNAV